MKSFNNQDREGAMASECNYIIYMYFMTPQNTQNRTRDWLFSWGSLDQPEQIIFDEIFHADCGGFTDWEWL